MYRFRFSIVVVAGLIAAALAAQPSARAVAQAGPGAGAGAGAGVGAVTPANVDISQRHLNESEETIAVNPTNPRNIVTVTNVGHGEAGLTAGMVEGGGFHGGETGAAKRVAPGGGDPLGGGGGRTWPPFEPGGQLVLTS